MNRRTFWTVITGGLLGSRLGWFKDPSRWWASVDMARPTIDVSVLDFAPLIKSFKELELQGLRTGRTFDQMRKDICASPVFLNLVEEDDD